MRADNRQLREKEMKKKTGRVMFLVETTGCVIDLRCFVLVVVPWQYLALSPECTAYK